MATIKGLFGNTGLTVDFGTRLNSLANNTATQSAWIDNTSNLFLDVFVQMTITLNTATATAGTFEIYAAGLADETNAIYPDTTLASPGATITLISPPNIPLIGIVNIPVGGTTFTSKPMSIASAFGGTLPAKWCLVFWNKSNIALAASAGSVIYRGTYMQSA